ncbi:MAG: hypothetical protein U5L11_00160 [Arhodomonas sp.]|nr:hypothetical protein [Arhodomonas sp.]
MQERLDAARESVNAVRGRRHDVALRLESAGTARSGLREAIERVRRQHEHQGERLR